MHEHSVAALLFIVLVREANDSMMDKGCKDLMFLYIYGFVDSRAIPIVRKRFVY